MDSKLAVLIIAVAQLCAAYSSSAPCECTRQYSPVCGSNGETYNNQCLLDCVRHSGNSHVTLVNHGPCTATLETGICGCSLDYIPVCGSDARTYPNACHVSCKSARNPSLNIAYEGECNLNVPHPNVCVCGNEQKPVCGSDNITYANDCFLNCATAKDPTLRIAYNARCNSNHGSYQDLLRDSKSESQ